MPRQSRMDGRRGTCHLRTVVGTIQSDSNIFDVVEKWILNAPKSLLVSRLRPLRGYYTMMIILQFLINRIDLYPAINETDNHNMYLIIGGVAHHCGIVRHDRYSELYSMPWKKQIVNNRFLCVPRFHPFQTRSGRFSLFSVFHCVEISDKWSRKLTANPSM